MILVAGTGRASRRGAEYAAVMSTTDLPPRSRIVAEALERAGVPGRIRAIAESARTAPEAAAAVGVPVGAIANSLIFTATLDDDSTEPVLLLVSGAHRVDVAATAERIGVRSLGRATPDQVRAATGQAIGGVAPVGHPAPVRTWVDETLAEHPEIWAAGGTPHTLFPISYDQLVGLAGGRTVRVD